MSENGEIENGREKEIDRGISSKTQKRRKMKILERKHRCLIFSPFHFIKIKMKIRREE